MADRKRRRRTGCLTCRARRVKCDEAKPVCERCDAANIECAGYEEKRHIDIRQPKRTTPVPQADTPATSPSSTFQNHSGSLFPVPRFRADGLPLVALPNLPTATQRPHAQARDVLAYHQFLFRTLPILFPSDHLNFWRDYLCQQAWEAEYTYEAIIALGSLHRAVLLMSRSSKNDQDRGLDIKVIAFQRYTQSLQELSNKFQDPKEPMALLIGTLILWAYFECFARNITAAIRHFRVANYYFRSSSPNSIQQAGPFWVPIDASLRDLSLVCSIAVPFPNVIDLPQSLNTSVSSPGINTPSPSSSTVAAVPSSVAVSAAAMQRHLLEIVSADVKIKELIWSPFTAQFISASPDKVHVFNNQLREWKLRHIDAVIKYNVESSLADQLYSIDSIDGFPVPPDPVSTIPPQLATVFALYAFCKARMSWTLSLINDDGKLERDTYFYVYQVMRFTANLAENSITDTEEPYLPCETTKLGVAPMLYLAGCCCPKQSWLSWISRQLRAIGQEGLFNCLALAHSLDALSILQKEENPDRFSPPSSRAISVLIPYSNERSFVTYYAKPRLDRDALGNVFYYPLGHSKWSAVGDMEPEVEVYDVTRSSDENFNADWLFTQPVVMRWVEWSRRWEFDVDRAIEDHINGGCLLPDAESMKM